MTTTMTNAKQKHHHHQDAVPVATANPSSRVAFGKNNKSQSLRRLYLPPSLTRLPNSIRTLGGGQQQISPHQVFSIEDTINSTQALLMRRQSTGDGGSDEGSFSPSSSSSSCNNIFSLTPAFSPPPHQAPPQVLPASLHRRKTSRAVRRGSKKSRLQQHPQLRSSLLPHQESHVQGSLSLAQIQALAQEEEQHHTNRPRKQQRNIAPRRRRTATTATTSKQHDDSLWESNVAVHTNRDSSRLRSTSPTPSVASCSTTASSSNSSFVTNTTKQSCMMSIASASPSLPQSQPVVLSRSCPSQNHQVIPQVPSAQAQQAVPSSSQAQAQQEVFIPPPLWTNQFACAVTSSIQQQVDVMIQNGNLPPPSHSNITFCDTLTPLDIVHSRSDSFSYADTNNSASDAVLGSGAFSTVTRVSLRTRNNKKSQSPSYQQQYFALKSLKRDLLPKVLGSSSAAAASVSSTADDEEEVTSSTAGFIKAAQELAREAYLLSRFDHSHIISIKGWTMGGVSSYQTYKRHDAFFLLLELLDKENLEDRIARWNQEDNNNKSSATHQHAQKVEQLTICRQVANALEYIHAKNVVYRDLKPQNIGFGRSIQDGQPDSKHKIHVKLMDFGLARELPTTNSNSNGRRIVPNQVEEQRNNINKCNRSFDMTGMVGTIRYMSPEIYLNQPYGVEADIYSWSIVSYEILSKIRPYNNMTPDLYHSLVCHQGVRPNTWHQHQQQQQQGQCQHEVPGQLPSEYLVLLANAWRTNPANRLPLHRIQRQIDLFLQKEQLLFEAQQILVTHMPTNNNNNEQSLIQQSFSYDNMGLTTTGRTRQQRQRHCGSSSASVASSGTKRSRRLVDACTNNSNVTFPTQGMNMMDMNAPTMLRSYTMTNRNHNHKNYQQHHCDVMNAARNILSTDPIMNCHAQLQSQRSPSDFRNRIMNRPQQQQQQFQQQQLQQQQETMYSPDHYYFLQQQQQQQQKEQRFLQEQQEQRAFTMRMMMTNTNTNNNNSNVNDTNNNNGGGGGGGSIQHYRRSISMPNEGRRRNGINNRRTNN